MAEIVADLSRANLQFSHPLLESHESEQNCVLLVLTSNRGLCGGYNAGVLREAMGRIREAERAGQNLRLEVAGKRGIGFLKFQHVTADAAYTHFEDRPAFEEVEELADRFIEWFSAKTIDRLDVAYMQFRSSSRQVAVRETLLPIGKLSTGEAADDRTARSIDYEFLPSAQEILEDIVPASFKARLFKCFLDAAVSEQIFRMVAMKAATENADEMIGNLSQKYNRARQTQITSELSEIIGGAVALE
jgi:F-type H+-transporting ATPase subunit gamma